MDKTIFEVEISNSGPKSYETATVMKMPASFAEFSDALQKARIKDGSFCKNELTCIHYNGLTHAMIGWNANLYDLNLFAQRLASLTEEQKKGMDALLKIKQNHRVAPIPLNQLINLTYNTDICCFAPRVSNHEELGAFLYANEMLSNEAMVSLILQNLYREILTVADENGGRLKNRVVFFADELGTCPPIQSLELMFSASRSRGLMLVPIVQSITGQLQKNYGKEGSEIIVDNCQVNLYGGFAPASQTAVELSKSLGSRTVMSGSISRGKNDPSQSLQMMERPLMTPDELKSMPKGSFIVAKTGVHPMKVKLRLFLDWGIRFGMPYEVPEKAQRFVAYADKQELEESIIRRHYGTIVMDSEQPQGGGTSAGGMAQGIQAAPDSRKTVFRP